MGTLRRRGGKERNVHYVSYSLISLRQISPGSGVVFSCLMYVARMKYLGSMYLIFDRHRIDELNGRGCICDNCLRLGVSNQVRNLKED